MGIDTATLIRDVELWSLEVFAEAIEILLDQLDDAVPVGPDRDRTGPALRDTLEVRVGVNTATISYLAEHASFTDEGTDPHRIEGNPLLAFEIDGTTVIVHFVDHPGTEGTHWWTDIMSDANWADVLDTAAENVRF